MTERSRAGNIQDVPALHSDALENSGSSAPPSTAADDASIALNESADSSSIVSELHGKTPTLYRVYFNSKADAPNCWSVDQGTISSEIIVASIQLVGVNLISRLNLSADNVNEPKAWFETHGTLSLDGSHAVIHGI